MLMDAEPFICPRFDPEEGGKWFICEIDECLLLERRILYVF